MQTLPVRQLRASAEYLPTEEEKADIEFLALATTVDNDNSIIEKLDKGQYINVADIRGNTLMHTITERGSGQIDFIRLLHAKGAALDYKNTKGKTPLMIAVAFDRIEYIKYLIDNGADLHALDSGGMSLLHIACWYGHHTVLEYLLKQKACTAHLETRDVDGRTPLLVASFRASTSCCELLQSAGANVLVEDNRQNKPAELAGRTGRRKSKELFESWEATLNVATAAVKLKGKLHQGKEPSPQALRSSINKNASPPSRRVPRASVTAA